MTHFVHKWEPMENKHRVHLGDRIVMQFALLSFWACLAGLSVVPAIAAPANESSATQLSQCAGEHDESAEQVIAACTALIGLGKGDTKELSRVYAYRALGYQRKGDLSRALADADQAIKLDATSAVAFHRRGDIRKGLRQDDLALADLGEAIRLDPKVPLYFVNRGNVYLDKHQYDLALHDLDEALRLDPKDEMEAIVNRCNVLTFKGDFPAAMADCQKALKQWPGDDYPLSRLGFLYFRMDKLDDSIRAYDAALAVPGLGSYDPYDKAYPLYGRGLAKVKKGDKTGGEADRAAALALDKDIARDFE
jgi:tetratricopeptide (TPR) repeat protein